MALDSDVGLINPPRFVSRLEITAQSLFQCGTVPLHSPSESGVIWSKTALGQQLFDIAE